MTVQYEGGYFLLDEPFVRGFGPNGHTANDQSRFSGYTVEAVNAIQDTPWQINRFVLDTITQFKELGQDVTVNNGKETEVILRFEMPVDPRSYDPVFDTMPPEQWQQMIPKDRKKHRRRRAKTLKKYEEHLGVWRSTKRIYDTAVEMTQFDKFYFPHNLDFRTRIYPIPTDLTPQSNDFSKGLLRFARPTALGDTGLFWMGFTVASHYGKDKLSPEDRYLYAKSPEFLAQCEAWVDDPLTNQGWLKTDAPFQFLAVAHEWVWAHRMPDPRSFMSYLPGNLDGSCNGAQHLSILSRDLVGATATNCRNIRDENGKPVRNDLYLGVGNKVWDVVQSDAAGGVEEAMEWLPKLVDESGRRTIVKRSVMTVPYGVTEFGVAEFMLKEHVDVEAENAWDEAKYMRDRIWSSIGTVLKEGQAIQKYFSTCALICAEAAKPLVWDTPAGSKVTQAYRNVIQRRIKGYDTKFYIYEEPEEDESDPDFLNRIGFDSKKMATAAPPNVVHSCDASHLQITVCRMKDVGIKDFSMIHDSFGCPFAHVGLMRDILRKSIVDMYGDNYLLKWKQSVEKYSGLKMPEPPALGGFDINEILESEFFFS